LRLSFFGEREVNRRFGLSVIEGVATSAFRASSNDSGASETGCDLVEAGVLG
jgi:hypothetical protein